MGSVKNRITIEEYHNGGYGLFINREDIMGINRHELCIALQAVMAVDTDHGMRDEYEQEMVKYAEIIQAKTKETNNLKKELRKCQRQKKKKQKR